MHPQARAALAELARAGEHSLPGRPGFDLARTRIEHRARASGGPPVAHVADADLGGVPCRLFRPRPGAPVVVHLHGGGWTFGSVAESEAFCRAVSERSGWAVLAVEYRLAPEHPYPAAIEDVERVLAALPPGGLGVDTTRLAVTGDSAGANLAAACALRARDRGASPWALQVLLYPVLDLVGEHPSRREFAVGYGLDRPAVVWHADAYTPDPADRARTDVSPLCADSLAGLPPALVITAGCDPLRDEGEAYAVRLADAGVPVVACRYPGMIHGFADPNRFDAAHAVIDQIAGALRGSLTGAPPWAAAG